MISENAERDVQAKLEQFAQANGGTLKGLKRDDAYRQAYPDAVDLFEWRRQWMLAISAEEPERLPAPPAAE